MSRNSSVSNRSSITSEDYTESEKDLAAIQDEPETTNTHSNAITEKNIILIQFQPQFQTVVMSGILLSYISTILDAAFAFSTEEKNIPREYSATLIGVLYCLDVIYLIDVTLMTVFRNSRWTSLNHLYDRRHVLLLVFDIISVIPLDAVYFSLTIASMRIIYILRLRYTLRIFRFFMKMKELQNLVGHNPIIIDLAEIVLSIILEITTLTCIAYIISCQFTTCQYIDAKVLQSVFSDVYSEFSTQGFAPTTTDIKTFFFLMIATQFFSFIYIYGYVAAVLLVKIGYKIRAKQVFRNMQKYIIRNMQICGCKDEVIISAAKQYYVMNLKNNREFAFDKFNKEILPETMMKDLNLDICWDALKHSHLFRDKDVSFLRVLSSIMVQKLMIPGEVIFKRGQLKSSMVYVASGVIQILSELDAETPIISLTRGTCIGEISLFQSNPAISTVVCQSHCKLFILNKSDLIKIILKHRDEFRVIKEEIITKYSEIKVFEKILNDLFSDENNKRESLALRWLKVTYKELTTKRAIPNKDKKVLTLDERSTRDTINLQLFSAASIDMLVICEDIELVTDTVFMKVSFPFIIQPDSFVVTIWNNIISWTILIFVCVFPYYASFQPITSVWFTMLAQVVMVLCALDIYITLSTAIKTSDHIISNFSEIANTKMAEFSFIVDILAAIPLRLFVVILMDVPSQTQVLLQITRILKFYKIQYIFRESLTMIDDVPRAYLEYTVYLTLLIYYFAAFLHLEVCYNFVCETNNEFLTFIERIVGSKTYPVLMWIYLSIQYISKLGIMIDIEGKFVETFSIWRITFETCAMAFSVYYMAKNGAIVAVNNYEYYKLHNYILSLKIAMQGLNVKPRLQQQLLNYIDGQFVFNDCFNILYSYAKLQTNFNSEIYDEFSSNTYSDYVRRIPIFEDLPDQVISSISQAFYINLMVPNQVITYYGEICTERHTILSGFCALVTNTGKIFRILKPGDHITEIELCFKIPVANTIISLTHCKLLSVQYVKLMDALQKYPTILWNLNNTISIIKSTVNIDALYMEDNTNLDINILQDEEIKSFINVGYMSRDTSESAQYHDYFEEHEFLGFLKYVLMRGVFTSYGSFIKYWEISRCIFAFMILIFTPMITINPCTNCGWNYFLYFLDVTAWIDIYIRHHITYFNEINIEIVHPIKTASYYWKHAFIIDLIAILPFEIIIGSFISDNQTKVFLRMSRFLQCHRIAGAINYLSHSDLNITIEFWTLAKFIPFLVIFIHIIAYICTNASCEFHPNIGASAAYEAGVKCIDKSWLTQSLFKKPLSPLRVHFYGLFYIAIILLKPAIGGFTVVNQTEVICVTILAFIGVLIYMYMTSQVLAVNMFRNVDTPQYQQGMSSLIKFLSYKRIDINLRVEVIKHFEYTWKKLRGKILGTMIKRSCHPALRGDILFDVYGVAMTNSVIFQGAPSAFFKAILLNAKHEIIMKRGLITQVNNVHGIIYIIFKGRVEVLGPDYNRLLLLSVGSIFGNIDNYPMSRQTLTMVAKGHVELLTIESIKFHHILSKYPQLKVQYHRLIGLNADYILGTKTKNSSESSIQTRDISRIDTNVSLKSSARFDNVIDFLQNHSKLIMEIWESFILLFPCFFGLIIELYINTVIDTNTFFIVILYVLDVLFIIKIILTFFTSYEDEFGNLVIDRNKIAKAYINDRTGFRLHVASVFPFEILALFFLKSSQYWYIWIRCRSNRFIRLYVIFHFVKKKSQTLNINVKLIHTLTLVLRLYISFQALASIFIVIGCINPNFNTTPPLKCDWLNLKSSEKFEIYRKYFAGILNIFNSDSMHDYVVNSSFLIVFVVVLLLCCKLIQIATIAEILATLASMYKIQGDYVDDIKLLKAHMIKQRTSPVLFDRIWLYVCILWKTTKGLQFPKFLEVAAPYYLKEAVLNSMFGFHLRKHPTFGKCHVDLLRQMAVQMETRIFLDGDYIAFMNDYDECMYFVHEGSVEALSEDDMESEKIEAIYKRNSMFGLHQGLYLRSGHEYSYRARRYTTMVVLQRAKWIHLLDFFPASQEIIYRDVKK